MNEARKPSAFRAVTIEASGAQLSGRYYAPAPGTSAPGRLPILLCGATGIVQVLYTAFAEWLAGQGYTVLTFDYRGIGESLAEPSVRLSNARKQDWGELDMPAALDWLLRETGKPQAHLLGHSAGGQLVGLMPNHPRIRSVTAVSGSSGYVHRLQPLKTRLGAWLMLSVFIPLSCRTLGYAPSKAVGWGEDLPPGVARQWAQWCSRPGYVENGFGKSIGTHYYAEFAAPITVLRAIDDPIATPANVADLLRLFPNAQRRSVDLHPTDFGLTHIGHIDMFRRRCSAVWPSLIEPIVNA